MNAIFDLKRSADQFLFNLKAAGNSEILLTSERYTEKANAIGGIESIRQNAPIDERYDKRVSVAGEPYFVLKARNGEIIATSEMYASTSARDKGINAVKHHAPEATLRDRA